MPHSNGRRTGQSEASNDPDNNSVPLQPATDYVVDKVQLAMAGKDRGVIIDSSDPEMSEKPA